MSQDGLIITNAHVLQNAPATVTVILEDGKRLPADVIGFAKNGLDLAAITNKRLMISLKPLN